MRSLGFYKNRKCLFGTRWLSCAAVAVYARCMPVPEDLYPKEACDKAKVEMKQ